ncbi:hypothetical protein CVT26_011563 [Gymnopilus dilepis]|uniref:Uncharacterized protein n=1 Tax=Gymnopilus dilepis TaxID=231916 RepID=A0A409WX05_9AGAR|nr:hypothetical protein CVT26_011563 [Gymnopilus dilepis]
MERLSANLPPLPSAYERFIDEQVRRLGGSVNCPESDIAETGTATGTAKIASNVASPDLSDTFSFVHPEDADPAVLEEPDFVNNITGLKMQIIKLEYELTKKDILVESLRNEIAVQKEKVERFGHFTTLLIFSLWARQRM